MAQGVLLDAAADLVHGLGGELHDMERVEHGGRVGELVVDRVLVATERIEGGDLDVGPERVAAGLQPVLVHRAGSARDQIEQPGPGASVLVTGQVDHAGQLFRATLDRADVVPDVLVDPEGGDAGEPGLILRRGGQDRPDRGPHRLPRRAELTGHPGHRAVLATDLMHRPPAGPCGEHGPRLGDLLVLLGEHPDRTRRLRTFPGPFPPPQLDRPAERRSIHQPHRAPAMTRGDDPAGRAAHHRQGRLDRHPQPAAIVPLDPGHVQPVEPDQQVTALAVAVVIVAAHGAARRLRHRSRSLVQKCGNS